jgi:purine-binding chemotaxis protein CheW
MMDHTSRTFAASSRSTSYLTFLLGEQEYGIEVERVRGIVVPPPMTTVPGSPAVVAGVINLRGKVVPVLSLRQRIGLPPGPSAIHLKLVEVDDRYTGLLVDRAGDVVSLCNRDLQASAPGSLALSAAMVHAQAQRQGRNCILLAIERVLALGECALPEQVVP